MFTGIIETTGTVKQVISQAGNKIFWIESSLSQELKIDQSLSHNGVCLTVEEIAGNRHRVTAVNETLKKTNLGSLTEGSVVNLERCMALNGRLDGHLVQGHVDATGTCIGKKEANGSWELRFEFPASYKKLVIEKGSISLNGISLTIFNVTDTQFTVAIIPYTYQHTNIQFIEPGTSVNLEFDMIGKYVQRNLIIS
jgi:riboflavin synthase